MAQESALVAGPGADEEGGALRGEGIGGAVAGQEFKSDESIEDGRQAALGGSGSDNELLHGFGTFIKDIENAVADGSLKNERRRKAPGKLKDAFRRDRWSR